MKNNKGITLIALVVTIIVLLILAGVSIAMLTGQNGILNRASQATWQSKLGDAESTVALTVSNYLADYYSVKYAGGTSNLTGVTSTATEDEVVAAAITAADTELGSDFSVSRNTSTKAITITYKEKYSVEGTVSGSTVNWGTMTESNS